MVAPEQLQLTADVRPSQPHRAQLAGAMGGETRAEEDVAGRHGGRTGPWAGPEGLVMVAPEQSSWPPMFALDQAAPRPAPRRR